MFETKEEGSTPLRHRPLKLSNGAAQPTKTWAAVGLILPTRAGFNKWFFGNEASTPARLVRYSSHYSTSTEHSTANAKGHAIGRSPVPNNTGRTLSFLYVIASYIILSDNIASYNVIRQAAHAKGAVHHRTWPVPEAPDRSGLAPHGACRTFRGTQAVFEA